MPRRDFDDTPRYAQILQDVERRLPHRWLALDDEFGDGAPQWAWANFVQAPSALGLGCTVAVESSRRQLEVTFKGQHE